MRLYTDTISPKIGVSTTVRTRMNPIAMAKLEGYISAARRVDSRYLQTNTVVSELFRGVLAWRGTHQ